MTEITQSKTRDKETEKFESETGMLTKLKHVYNEFSVTDDAENLLSNSGLGASPYEVGGTCLNHTKILINATLSGEKWAQRSKFF
jgi:hypothetical protein